MAETGGRGRAVGCGSEVPVQFPVMSTVEDFFSSPSKHWTSLEEVCGSESFSVSTMDKTLCLQTCKFALGHLVAKGIPVIIQYIQKLYAAIQYVGTWIYRSSNAAIQSGVIQVSEGIITTSPGSPVIGVYP